MNIQINREDLNKMYDSCAESITEVFNAFLESESEVLNELNIAFDNENEKLIKQQLHYHAAVFGYIGFKNVTEFFKKMEQKYMVAIGNADMKEDLKRVTDIVKQVASCVRAEKEAMKQGVYA